ncbi:MAG: NAD+ synthase [bacterium]
MALRIALAQFNPWMGALAKNVEMMEALYQRAMKERVDLLVFPEMSVCGYPPEDLLLNDQFLHDTYTACEELAQHCSETTILAGLAYQKEGKCYNALGVLAGGRLQQIYHKCLLPNYGVFDERRYFQPGEEPFVIHKEDCAIVLTICEDIWDKEWLDTCLAHLQRKDLIINISASPFHIGKIKQREHIVCACARYFQCALAYCNMVGGQDELVFDGRSMFVDPDGSIVSQAKAFDEDLLIADIFLDRSHKVHVSPAHAERKECRSVRMDTIAEVYNALLVGTRDYVSKSGFHTVLIGLSGGIDSALTAALAVDALGAGNVIGVTMPSQFNSQETISDAELVATNLGIRFHTIPIGDILANFDKTLRSIEGWDDRTVAYENLQARIRGTILMSLSNQFSYLVLTTGNKSETAVGYSTLYGDTAGGFAVIKDVPKTMVYDLSYFINNLHGCTIIPESVITRVPSAELRENQRDSDSLPEYSLLDRLLKGYIEDDLSAAKLAEEGLDTKEISRVIHMVDRNEYKRRQSPPGIKITPKAFGKDRRMPIVNHYRRYE